MHSSRRRVLAGLTGVVTALAGCSGSTTPTESPTPPQYRDRFERNLDRLDVRSLSFSNGTATLAYNATDVGESAMRADTRTVAVAWAQVIGAGWAADRLRVRVYHEGAPVARYHIDATWADKFNNGTDSFDADDYGSHIESTFETVTATPTES